MAVAENFSRTVNLEDIHSSSLPPERVKESPEKSSAGSCPGPGYGEQEARKMGEVDYESLPTNNLGLHLLAGALAGTMEHCCMYPVDCVKTRMMSLVPNPNANYRNLFQAFARIMRTEHPMVLFRGIGVVASGAGPAHALYFSCYEFSKKALTRPDTRSTVLAQGGAGTVATLIHDGFMNPIDVIKQRLQIYNSPYRGAFHCASQVYKREGIGAFYRSYTTQLSMNVPFQVVHFIAYEFQQDVFNPTRTYYPLSHMLSGAGAGAFAAAITTPLDVAKTLLNTCEQLQCLRTEQRTKGMFGALARIYRMAGVLGFFRGVTPRIVYQSPSTAICWSVYEFFKYCFGLKQQEEIAATNIANASTNSR